MFGVYFCGTSNYQNPVGKFSKFPFTEPLKWKTPLPAKLLIECNSGRNSFNYMFVKSQVNLSKTRDIRNKIKYK